MSFYRKQCLSLVVICILAATYSYGQIKVSEVLQESKIASADNNKLFFVDFWATWCAPCITAKEHLGVLQKQFPNDFYVVSLSSENPLIVEKFLKKKPNELAVAIDYNKETFKKYNVQALPEGVLFNAEGKVLWQGGAPDLKAGLVSKFLRQQGTKASFETFFKVVSVEDDNTSEYIPVEALEIKSLSQNLEELIVVDNSNYLKNNGFFKTNHRLSSKNI